MAIAKVLMALTIVSASLSADPVGAQVQHLVGGDRGWDPLNNFASWSASRVFRVGDKIWFSYSAAHGEIVELKTKEEYKSCNVSNPIRMYTDGINSVPLDGEGIRYFASSNTESCKNGLKLHVEVQPQGTLDKQKVHSSDGSALAAAGPTPSDSTHLIASFVLLVAGLGLCFMSI
ncbi:hypothetical protein K2173_009847 [Erythroxylum novogranatense]|uniref:Phytocyanin domain-containing protein n=1 Tax=Erythroxylum novogranatense TaxID=1862640 RepID=A0AAV8SZ49_9ROSI|nr:hypothetical protein K2173_009847 [Erythroxylum novogranatense]